MRRSLPAFCLQPPHRDRGIRGSLRSAGDSSSPCLCSGCSGMVSISDCVPGPPVSGTTRARFACGSPSEDSDPKQKAGVGWHFPLLCCIPHSPLFKKVHVGSVRGERKMLSPECPRGKDTEGTGQLASWEVSLCSLARQGRGEKGFQKRPTPRCVPGTGCLF